jgi:hypothetical protein
LGRTNWGVERDTRFGEWSSVSGAMHGATVENRRAAAGKPRDFGREKGRNGKPLRSGGRMILPQPPKSAIFGFHGARRW